MVNNCNETISFRKNFALMAAVVMSVGLLGATLTTGICQTPVAANQPIPTSWVDADTGHRITRLTDEPGSIALYFNVNAYTPDRNDMVYMSRKGLYDLDLSTMTTRRLVAGITRFIFVGTRTRRVYFLKSRDLHVYRVSIDTGLVEQLAELPPRSSMWSINADETLAAGSYLEGTGPDLAQVRRSEDQKLSRAKLGGKALADRWALHQPEAIFTANLNTGQIKVIHRENEWISHVLFSPTDPTLMMYCREGPVEKVDRIWTIRADGSDNKLVHQRTIEPEAVVHEFWSQDGKTIWYDLQRPKGTNYSLAGYNVLTGKRTVYQMTTHENGAHFNASSDNSVFCGDGNEHQNRKNSPDRQWIELLHPQIEQPSVFANQVDQGTMTREKLVNMKNHDYGILEPNARFSPDNRLVIFSSNMLGQTYVFAVEVAPATGN